jgi:hypothetical protein
MENREIGVRSKGAGGISKVEIRRDGGVESGQSSRQDI